MSLEKDTQQLRVLFEQEEDPFVGITPEEHESRKEEQEELKRKDLKKLMEEGMIPVFAINSSPFNLNIVFAGYYFFDDEMDLFVDRNGNEFSRTKILREYDDIGYDVDIFTADEMKAFRDRMDRAIELYYKKVSK